MLLKDHVDCRFLHEDSKLKRATQTLFHNCPFCLVVSVLANTHLVCTSKHIPR